MSAEGILFWVVFLFTASSAALVATTRNILHAAFALGLTFLGVSGIYLFLHADFVAAVQLIVYVGGIVVLIMFGIMFSSHSMESPGEEPRSKFSLMAGGLAALGIFAVLVLLIRALQVPLSDQNSAFDAIYQRTVAVAPGQKGLGHYLLGEYLLPFEVVSILILGALAGAISLIRKETTTE